jgi:MFS family permease
MGCDIDRVLFHARVANIFIHDCTSFDLDIRRVWHYQAQLTLSIFVLAYAIGPLFLGPLSEIYGRVIVLQLSNLFYLAWNLGCGFAQTSGQLMAFRFFSGLGGSAPLAIGGVRYLFAACPKI